MNDLVFNSDSGNPVTTSKLVAEKFNKNHYDVLKAIRNLDCSEDFQKRNFAVLLETRKLPNGGVKEYPYYIMTRDGFSFLAMGFTGKKAAEFKEDFIDAFNYMERTIMSKKALPNFQNPIEAARAWADAEEARLKAVEASEEAERVINQLAPKVEQQDKEIKKQAPKVQYYNEVLQSDSTYTTTQIAKELGMGAPTLNRKLQSLGVQYKQSGQWLLYHKHQGKGYTKTHTYTYTDSNTGETKTSMNTVWTEEGRKFIHQVMAKKAY